MSAAQRVLLVVVIAIVVGIAAASLTPWQASPLVGWIAGGLWYLGSVWLKIAHLTPEETHALSTREDDSRFAAELLLVSASVTSLVGTALALLKANDSSGGQKAFLSTIAVATVVVSWAVVHTTFALRYRVCTTASHGVASTSRLANNLTIATSRTLRSPWA